MAEGRWGVRKEEDGGKGALSRPAGVGQRGVLGNTVT